MIKAAVGILLLLPICVLEVRAQISPHHNYIEEELTIKISDSISLSGILTTPLNSNSRLLIILVSPPLRHDRDYTTKNPSRKMFKALSDEFTSKGLSVFRFDNRGVNKSTGNNDSATLYTHADDIEGIVRFFKQNKSFKKKKIGLVGISEGGSVSQVVAARRSDVSFLVLLSTTGLSGWDAFKHQVKRFYEIRGATFGMPELADSMYQANVNLSIPLHDILNQNNDIDSIRRKVKAYLTTHAFSKDTAALEGTHFMNRYNHLVLPWTSPQQIALKKFNPAYYLSKVECPVLALNGTRDDVVDWSPDLDAIKEALTSNGNKNVLVVPLEDVNHSYQTLKNEKIWARVNPNEKFSQKAVDLIVEWLKRI